MRTMYAISLSSCSTRFSIHRSSCFRFSKSVICLLPLFRSSYGQSNHHTMLRFCVGDSSNTSSSITTNSSCPLADPLVVDITKIKPPPKQQPWLIVGLGNPGKKYAGTRHNVGFDLIDALAEAEGISMSAVSFKASFGKGFIGDVPVMLAKPQTFMNSSGESVGAIVSYYKIPLKQVLVIFDDLDLPFGKLRLLPKGGHGGHNGMRSIIHHFKGSLEFPRLRIGIGRPPGKMDTITFVLRPFTKQEQEELNFTLQRCMDAIRILVLEGFNKSATYVNSAKPLEQTI